MPKHTPGGSCEVSCDYGLYTLLLLLFTVQNFLQRVCTSTDNESKKLIM